MKIAISNIAWNKDEELTIKSILTDAKITAVEVAPTKLWDNPLLITSEDIESAKNFWSDSKIDIVAMQSLLFGKPKFNIFNDPDNEMLSYLKHIINIGVKLGVKYFVFGSPKNRKIHNLSDIKWSIALDFFAELGNYAFEKNAFFCIEPNPPIYECDFITNTSEAVKLIQTVNNPGFQLHLDSAALSLNKEDFNKSIEIAAPYLKHFHISEPYLEPIYQNNVNHQMIATALKKINYQNYVSIEMKSTSDENSSTISDTLNFVTEIYSY